MLKNLFIIVVIFLLSLQLTSSQEDLQSLNKQGLKLQYQGLYEESIKYFDKVLAKDPKAYQVWFNKANSYYMMGEFGKAGSCYDKVIELNPKYAPAYCYKGLALFEAGNLEKAKKYFNMALDLDSELTGVNVEIKSRKSDKGNNFLGIARRLELSTLEKLLVKKIRKIRSSYEFTGRVLGEETESVNGVNFTIIHLEGGTFMMGSNEGLGDSMPVHKVDLGSYWIGKYEVTNREYCQYDSSHENPGDNLPVVNVSWEDAVKYCSWLSGKTGKKYRLPTEAEWEYACRGGTYTNYYWGDSMSESYCWYDDNSGGQVHPVGQKSPNVFGLFDMSGNVLECCSDWYDSNYYSQSPSNNPAGPGTGSGRVFRGGGWSINADYCRSAYRFRITPDIRYDILGFRLCRSAP